MQKVKTPIPQTRKRVYHSPLRDEAARQTRRRIVAAARALLLERGYHGCSISDIASRAEVARPTVIASFGSKAAILTTVVDEALAGDDTAVPVAQRDWFRPVWDAQTPAECVDAYAGVCTLIGHRAGAVFEAVRRSAGDGADIAALWDHLQAGRRAGATMVVDRMAGLGTLTPALDHAAAIDVMWVLNDPGLHHALVDGCHWAQSTFEEWLAAQMKHALLPPLD